MSLEGICLCLKFHSQVVWEIRFSSSLYPAGLLRTLAVLIGLSLSNLLARPRFWEIWGMWEIRWNSPSNVFGHRNLCLKSTSHGWWKAESTLRNTSWSAAKSSHSEEIPVSSLPDESSGAVSWVSFHSGSGETRLVSTGGRCYFVHPSRNTRALSAKNTLVLQPEQAEGWFYFLLKIVVVLNYRRNA